MWQRTIRARSSDSSRGHGRRARPAAASPRRHTFQLARTGKRRTPARRAVPCSTWRASADQAQARIWKCAAILPEQKVLRCTVGTLEQTAREADVTKTALIVVGEVLDGTYERSKLYDPTFTTEFRQASCSKKDSGQTGEDQSTEMRQEAEEQNK